MKRKAELKYMNNVKDKGKKIRLLMDILERKNTEIRYLRKKLWHLEKHNG